MAPERLELRSYPYPGVLEPVRCGCGCSPRGSAGQALQIVRDGGTVIEVGAIVDMGDEAFNPAVVCARNLCLLGVGGEDLTAYAGTLALLARHQRSVAFAEMVSRRFAISDAPRAMEVALDAEASAKVLIMPTGA